jgi:hypothetical protein
VGTRRKIPTGGARQQLQEVRQLSSYGVSIVPAARSRSLDRSHQRYYSIRIYYITRF